MKIKKKKYIFLVLFRSLISEFICIQSLLNSRGECHLVTLAKGHLFVICQQFQRTSTLNLNGQFLLNFLWSPKAERGKVYIFGPGHMNKMAAMLYIVKNFFSSTTQSVALELGT